VIDKAEAKREKCRLAAKRWRENHPEYRVKHRLEQRRYNETHKEKIALYDKNRPNIPERKAKQRERYHTDILYRERLLRRMKKKYVRVYGDDEESLQRRKEKNRRNLKIATEKGNAIKRAAMEQRKKEFLNALDENIGIVTTVCIKQGISRDTYYRWLRHDPAFAERVQEIKDRGIDFAEDMLMSKIVAGDLQAVMFFLRSQGKHRGWNDKVDVHLTASNNVALTDRLMENLDEETRDKLVSAYKQVRNDISKPVLLTESETIDVEVKPA
jgi:hypothetical protein